MKLDSLRNILSEHIKDLYNAETQLVKAFLQLEGMAASPDLKRAFFEQIQQLELLIAAAQEIRDLDKSTRVVSISL